MGTRRPLIVQMVHDASATAPRCMLQEEDSDAYGPPIPESEIADAIKERTQKHLRAINAQVSGKPIVHEGRVRATQRSSSSPVNSQTSHFRTPPSLPRLLLDV